MAVKTSRSGFFGRLTGLDIEAELQRHAVLLKGQICGHHWVPMLMHGCHQHIQYESQQMRIVTNLRCVAEGIAVVHGKLQ